MTKEREVGRVYRSSATGPAGDVTRSSRTYCSESQSILSVSHAPDYRHLGSSNSDIGGPFLSTKLKWGAPTSERISLQGDLTPSDFGWRSEGQLVPGILESEMALGLYAPSTDSFKSFASIGESESSARAYGATAISRVAPTNPVWDGASAIAELYGAGVPLKAPFATKSSLVVDRKPEKAPLSGVLGHLPSNVDDLKAINLGGEYLNIQFGYAPTVSDIATLRDTARRSEKILAQLERDSGKAIRRSYQFPEEELPARGPYSGGGFPMFLGGTTPTAYEVMQGTWRLTYKRTRSRKFSGAFMYHLPPKGTWRRKISELDALYGVRPGIDTAWNAVPFSWLADYFGNTGDVLKNITAFAQDGLVLKYGYITTVTEDVGTFVWDYPVRRQGDRNAWSSASGTCQLSIKTISRWPANPFGFGAAPGSLSDRQLAIVAALGLSLKR